MADISVEVAGIRLGNPVLTAAGPTSRDGETLTEAARGGAGGLVAKTISVKPAEVPRPCMIVVDRGRTSFSSSIVLSNRVVNIARSYVAVPRGMLNAELWSDVPHQQWIEREYSVAKQTGLPVIASMGYTAEEVAFLGPLVQGAGVDGIEFSLHYVGIDYGPILEIAKALRESVDVPIFAKLSPHIMNLQEFARELERTGVDGLVAINSLGPCLYIDTETGKPLLGGEGGHGWLSGPAIKPLGIRVVAEAAKAVKIPIIGVGGVMAGLDAVEYFMAGASAVQICTGAIIEGPTIYGRVAREINEYLDSHGHDSVEDIKGVALKYLPEKPLTFEAKPPIVDDDLCKLCGLCEKSCVYGAIELRKDELGMSRPPIVDEDRCYGCGVCVSICPVRALSFEEELEEG